MYNMYNLINTNGKILATGNLTKIELLQERIDPFAVKTAIVEDEAREQVCRSEYDLPAGFHYDDGQSVDELEPVYDGFSAFIIDDTEWTDDEMKAYESHPSVIQNSIIQKTCDSRIEKLNCTRIPHLDHVHHKSTIDNITILHQVDFPFCD